MEFGLPGPLVVKSGETVVPVPAARQRVLLAALLFHANRVVSVDELAEALWQATPPPTGRVMIQNYVKRLRHALGDADHSRISTPPGGYLIRAGAADVDVTRFEALQGQAGEACQGVTGPGLPPGCARRWCCGGGRRSRMCPAIC